LGAARACAPLKKSRNAHSFISFYHILPLPKNVVFPPPICLTSVRQCMFQISAWMSTNLLCLNPFLIIRLRHRFSKLSYSSDLHPTDLTSPVFYTLLRSAILEWSSIKNLTVADYITQLSRTGYICTFVTSVDYAKTSCTMATPPQLLIRSSTTVIPFSTTSTLLK